MADVDSDLIFATQLYMNDVQGFMTDDEDGALALQLQFGDVASYLQVLQDAQFAQSVGDASTHSTIRPCAICLEAIDTVAERNSPRALHAQCGHYICRECLAQLVRASARDEALYPPRCCRQPLPVDSWTRLVEPSLLSTFRAKAAEFSVPPNERAYCPTPRCSAFLGRKAPRERTPLTCQACQMLVCSSCAQPFHPRMVCEANKASFDQLRQLASLQRWKECPGCQTYIQKTDGCPHMVCRCRVEFCFTCGKAPWKTCACAK